MAGVTATAARDRATDTEAERPAQRPRTHEPETFEDATDAVLSAAAAAAAGYPVADRGIPPPPASLPTAAVLHRDASINAAVRGLQQGHLFEAIQPDTTVSGMGNLPLGNRPAFGAGRAPQGGDRPPQGLDLAIFSGGAAELWGQGAFSSNNMVLELSPSGGICAKEYGPTDPKTLVAKWQDVLRKLEQEPGREVECEHIRNYITWMTEAFLGNIAFFHHFSGGQGRTAALETSGYGNIRPCDPRFCYGCCYCYLDACGASSSPAPCFCGWWTWRRWSRWWSRGGWWPRCTK